MRSARSLPALVSLRAFEAAARRMSFSLAAQELFVTQSAVSHHIQRLEAELGVALFERRTRAVALTAAGQAYYERVHAAFELLRQGTDELRAPAKARQTLRVGLLASFATRWLAPRLAAFAEAHPDIDLQLQPDIGLADVAGGEVDVAIRYGRGVWPGVRARLIMTERLSVVCAPALIAGRKRPRAPQDLLRFPLLASHARHPFEWDAWARHHGVDLGGVQPVRLHDYNIVVEAALAGQGMAMGRHRLIGAQLASGALVEALPGSALEAPRIGWWYVTPRGSLGDAAQRFHAWLAQEAAVLDDTH
ncbi:MULTISPECIES: transcriptional regulator GcvA [Achromobacter]|uniref:Glycine cleavage system transcriptional activator n=1 Tax=Achromobacter anxifer TaxID=1287737 RepID=A0A6S7E8K0_9BURK|nr:MULTISPECIES: transcriptional regulator GcvA [Achromobacter]MDF8360079.1 transcriptional regulator GcvA [Achromobacter anxifer]CAB3900641.1 Glycine cleavage system transcriptional activator [Achromobacter anxifer]CAB5515499.1 Glycine cleavage system transcriptional activator [Achromobacter anxifer]